MTQAQLIKRTVVYAMHRLIEMIETFKPDSLTIEFDTRVIDMLGIKEEKSYMGIEIVINKEEDFLVSAFHRIRIRALVGEKEFGIEERIHKGQIYSLKRGN